MITKISKIKKIEGLGLFDGYRWPAGAVIQDFKRWNLIYGWNGSGKTSLSRLFGSFNTDSCEGFPELKYTIETNSAGNFSEKQMSPISTRIFNSDYIVNSIGTIEGGEINPIFIIGEDKRELAQKLRDGEAELEVRRLETAQHEKDLSAKNNEKGKEFTAVAKIIGEAAKGLAPRNYTKRNTQSAFTQKANHENLSEEELEKFKLTGRQSNLEVISQKTFPDLIVAGQAVEINSYLMDLSTRITAIGQETAQSAIIQSFIDKPEIGRWVEAGIKLHTSGEDCKFCGNPVQEKRLEEILGHFSEADNRLKQKINNLIEEVASLAEFFVGVEIPKEHQFFDELREEFSVVADNLTTDTRSFVRVINEKVLKILREKQDNRAQKIYTISGISVRNMDDHFKELNKIIIKHNEKVTNFEAAKIDAFKAVEEHFLSGISDEIESIDEGIQDLESKIELLKDGDPTKDEISISALSNSIRSIKGEIANTKIAADNLTKRLEVFLGRRELVFQPDGDGYRIFRNEVEVKNLSEGEKTAIAFIYFTVQLDDQDFDKTKGLIVIDDPMSSLDSNSLFQAFSFLKTAVKDSCQLIVLTHNFDFLKLLINWMKNIPGSKHDRNFLMIQNTYTNNLRTASLQPLDSTLQDYPSEYLYLLSRIFGYQCDGTIQNAYPMANIVRKALEHLLDFMCPDDQRFYKKLERLNFDEQKRTALNKFAQNFSHPTGAGIEPSLVQETRNCVTIMIELLQEVAPVHFESVCRKLNHTPSDSE